MNQHSRNLAIRGLAEFSAAVTPDYERLTQQLNSELVLSSEALEGFLAKKKESSVNLNALNRIAAILPHITLEQSEAKSSSGEINVHKIAGFNVETPAQIKKIQDKALWCTSGTVDKETVTTTHWPQWIIGEKQDGKWVELLLLKAADSQSTQNWKLCTIGGSLKEINKWRKLRSTCLTAPIEEEHLGSLYDSETEGYRVTHLSFGTSRYERYFSLLNNTRRIETAGFGKPRPMIVTSGYFDQGVSDKLLADYNVLSHANNLATLFGVKENLDEIYAQWGEK